MKKLLLLLLLIPAFCFSGSNNVNEAKSFENTVILMENSTKVDEFLDFWDNEFRKVDTCDVNYQSFTKMIEKYKALSSEERVIVDNTIDKKDGCPIKQVITTLINKFYKLNPENVDKKDSLTKSATIIVIVSVAVFGMTTISVFFLLKNKKIIE